MRRSVRLFLACVLLLSAAVFASALSRADFERVVDFSVSLKTLTAVAAGKAPLPTGKLVVLDGTVSDVNIINKEEATFLVRIELISGEWIGFEDVKSYTCYIDFSGPEFFKIFPARAPKNPSPEMVFLNTRLVVIGRPVDITANHQGEKRVLVEGLLVRPIK